MGIAAHARQSTIKDVLFGSMVGLQCRGRRPKRRLDITEWIGL